MEQQPAITTADGGGAAGTDEISTVKELRQKLEDSISARRQAQMDLISSLHPLYPDLIPSLDLSLSVISAFNHRPFIPTPTPNPNPKPFPTRPLCFSPSNHSPINPNKTLLPPAPSPSNSTDCLSVVRTMVAVCLLESVPFTEIDSAALLRRLENDQSSVGPTERAALAELSNRLGGSVQAVEMALRRIGEENGSIQFEELSLGGDRPIIMVWGIDRSRLLKELPETSNRNSSNEVELDAGNSNSGQDTSITGVAMTPKQSQSEIWMGTQTPHMMSPMFSGMNRSSPRVPGLMGMTPLSRPIVRSGGATSGGSNEPRTEEDDLKDLEMLLNKKTYKEKQQSKTGEELLDLIHRPTAKETAVAAKFKTKGGSQLKEYCSNLTKEDCRRQSGSFVACDKVHFRRIIALHTDTNLGDCSFLDTCRHTKTCKYVHYELDQSTDITPIIMGSGNLAPPRPMKQQRAEYCSEVELGEPQWINCDIRSFRMDILGQFGVIMADPPWDIHMELPYGTMADDEMRNLNVPALQTDGLIFLWVTGRAMELGRECLELWGYKRVEEIIWVKTNQLQRIIRTGRTGHWLNHSKEHCLVGIKGNPEVNRNIDTDVIVAEVRETSRKPDEMYPLLERISPRTRKLELFARMHNTQAGWLSLGNQLNGVRLVDEGLRARFKAAYPDVEVQPMSPPRASAPMDVDPPTPSGFATSEGKPMGIEA
ncbi:putative N6-adenosine-methyltransferase MT-A70-like protein [Carex littledalei]|uniref:Putative N6-adenosine-methyltransferase MT-A70-like protein n=1 Tax=Carex littledalei TaxID=544730 RepID=A0A833VE88_9POAL|nr:putative N6-adenosine-methyltransferase MT-A70-like protein [Carex littledalei]